MKGKSCGSKEVWNINTHHGMWNITKCADFENLVLIFTIQKFSQ